jgi:lysozyme family protein
MNFLTAFEKLIGHEGGYVNDPRDPGGETKYGISKRSYPNVDIKGLTLKDAQGIYYRDYWVASGCEQVPEAVRFDLFDTAVNSGIDRAVKLLQAAAGTAQDGKLGPKTIAAAQAVNGDKLKARYNGARLDFMTGLPTWQTFGKGWARRVASNLMND